MGYDEFRLTIHDVGFAMVKAKQEVENGQRGEAVEALVKRLETIVKKST